MARNPVTDGVIPQVIKVSVPQSAADASAAKDASAVQEGSAKLSGDYYLRLRSRHPSRLVWQVDFESTDGFSVAVLVIDLRDGASRARFQFLGKTTGGGPLWENSQVGSLRTDELAQFAGAVPVRIVDHDRRALSLWDTACGASTAMTIRASTGYPTLSK